MHTYHYLLLQMPDTCVEEEGSCHDGTPSTEPPIPTSIIIFMGHTYVHVAGAHTGLHAFHCDCSRKYSMTVLSTFGYVGQLGTYFTTTI